MTDKLKDLLRDLFRADDAITQEGSAGSTNAACAEYDRIYAELRAYFDVPAVEAAEIEVAAREIYESWEAITDYVPWVVGGNSTMQDSARRLARRILAGVNQQAGSEVPEGFVLAPERMHLDANVIEAINYHCGDGQENAGYGKHTDGLLWFGYVEDDDGVKSYGLNIATAEYPEEGSTQLVELKEPLPPSPAAKACDL